MAYHLWYDEQVVVFSVPWHLNLRSRWTIKLDHPICVTVWGCECVGPCDCVVRSMCVYSLALGCVKKCLLFALCFTLTPFNSRDSIYPQSQTIIGGKLGNLQDFRAETRLMPSQWDSDVQKQFRYTFDHVWFSFPESVSREMNQEADGERERVEVVAHSVYQRAFSEPLTTLPHLPQQHTDLWAPTQGHTEISPRFGWCV